MIKDALAELIEQSKQDKEHCNNYVSRAELHGILVALGKDDDLHDTFKRIGKDVKDIERRVGELENRTACWTDDLNELDACCRQRHLQKEVVKDTEGIAKHDEGKTYPCDRCGVKRTVAEGGNIFTVCDKCWDEFHKPSPEVKECEHDFKDYVVKQKICVKCGEEGIGVGKPEIKEEKPCEHNWNIVENSSMGTIWMCSDCKQRKAQRREGSYTKVQPDTIKIPRSVAKEWVRPWIGKDAQLAYEIETRMVNAIKTAIGGGK